MRLKRVQSGSSTRTPLMSVISMNQTGDNRQNVGTASTEKRRSSLLLVSQDESPSWSLKRSSSDRRWYQRISKSRSKKKERHSSGSSCSKKTGSPRFVSKPTSWTFVPANPRDTDFVEQGSIDFEIYSRSQKRKMEKQQVFSMLASSALPPSPTSPKFQRNGKENSLRQLLLNKKHPLKRRHFKTEQDLPLSDVSRTPGPIDGSLYAEVNKKKTLTASASLPSLPELQPFKSAGERQVRLSNSSLYGTGSSDAVRSASVSSVSAKEGVIKVDIKEGDVKLVVASTASAVSSSGKQQLDLFAGLSGNPPDSVKNPIPPRYQRIEDLNAISEPILHESKPSLQFTQTETLNVISVAVSESSTSLPRGRLSENLNLSTNLDYTETQSMQNVSLRNKEEEFLVEEIVEKRIMRTSKSFIVKSEIQENSVKVVLSKSVSLPCISRDDMAARGRPQLTKEQIHEAVSLVNECLSDQQMREGLLGPLSPYDTRHFSFSPLNSIQSPTKINSTENLLENADRIFSDAVFTPTVCIRTSKLDVLDDVIAKLASGEIALSRCELNSTSEQSTEHDELESGVAGSNPSHDDSQQPITSCSDVDSGIDGSALAGSTSSEVKHKLATLDSTAPFSGSDLDPASPSLDTNVPERLDGILEEKNLLRETPEERKVREEIELMEKRLEELQEKQNILRQRKQNAKRHSFDVSEIQATVREESETELSTNNLHFATLPKSPEKDRRKENTKQDSSTNTITDFSASSMMTTAYPADQSGSQYSRFGKTSPGFNTPDAKVAERANVFTPAYAHPMHHPRRMATLSNIPTSPQYYQHNQEEENKRRREDEQRMKEEKDSKRSMEIVSLRWKAEEKAPPKLQNKVATSRQISGSPTPPTDELQSQLDELDQYIAELTQNFEPSENISTKRSFQKSYSYNLEANSSKNNNIAAPDPTSPSVYGGKSALPPKPPSRNRSSYDSVCRRQNSTGFELAQTMKLQEPSGRGLQNASKDDDVFTSQGYPQPSYPPQTRHTRPHQQQVEAIAPTSAKSPPQKMHSLEDRISPQLFIAMSVNPGGRPVEEIHSYKEDLAPSGMDVVDSAAPTTPGFPVSPPTPYVNNRSPLTGHFPVGFVKTPLSALGLKHNPRPDPIINESTISHSNSVAQQNGHPSDTMTNSPKENSKAGLPNGRLDQSKPLQEGNGVQETIPSPVEAKLLTNHSHDSGYADSHPNVSSNGWIPTGSAGNDTGVRSGTGLHQQRPLNHSGPTFAYEQTSNGVSSGGHRSLSGSNDSLLSEGSSSSQSQHGYLRRTSQPALPPKESRNSRNSARTTSSGSSYVPSSSPQTSPTNPPVSSVPVQNHSYSTQVVQRQESRLSNYEKQVTPYPHQNNAPSDDGLGSPTSARTSSSSLAEIERLAHDLSQTGFTNSTPKFIKDTTSFWYKPDITRDQALAMLRHRPPGSFVVRDSRCYPGAFGLALKVHQVPAAVRATAKPGTDMNDELVRHFLIEPSSRGVKLKGSHEEPVFGSLSALIYQHSITPIALPCKLVIPVQNQEVPLESSPGQPIVQVSNTAAELLRQGAACNVLYLGSVDTELLTGPEAVDRSVRECIELNNKTTVVHFKVSPQGITLTDNARKLFFRRHYPTATINFCGLDPCQREPHNRRWNASSDRGPPDARMFGFVAKKSGSSNDNTCHVFAELDLDQPAHAIVNFVSKILIRSG